MRKSVLTHRGVCWDALCAKQHLYWECSVLGGVQCFAYWRSAPPTGWTRETKRVDAPKEDCGAAIIVVPKGNGEIDTAASAVRKKFAASHVANTVASTNALVVGVGSVSFARYLLMRRVRKSPSVAANRAKTCGSDLQALDALADPSNPNSKKMLSNSILAAVTQANVQRITRKTSLDANS